MGDSCPDIYVGIDPGAKGAIAFTCGRHHFVMDIPVMEVSRGKRKKTVAIYTAIVTAFDDAVGGFPPDMVYVGVEEAQVGIPGKGNSAYNGFRVGQNWGMWPLFLVSRGFVVEDSIRPSVWKKKMGLAGQDKEASRHKAISMFPRAELHLKRHHDRSEALLIAEYLRRTRQGKL